MTSALPFTDLSVAGALIEPEPLFNAELFAEDSNPCDLSTSSFLSSLEASALSTEPVGDRSEGHQAWAYSPIPVDEFLAHCGGVNSDLDPERINQIWLDRRLK